MVSLTVQEIGWSLYVKVYSIISFGCHTLATVNHAEVNLYTDAAKIPSKCFNFKVLSKDNDL